MDKLVTTARIFSKNFHNDDDFVDRTNHRYTTSILLIFFFVVSTKQYVGEPINCWCPAHFTSSHVAYANAVCWVKNTYYVPISEDHIRGSGPKKMIVYYQWVPMILLLLCTMFYVPRLFWKMMNGRSGVEVNDMVEAASALQITKKEINRERILQTLVQIMHRYLLTKKEKTKVTCRDYFGWALRGCCACRRTSSGNFLVIIFLLTKIGYSINAVGQFFLLNVFLGKEFHFYGILIVKAIINNEEYETSEMFPTITLCDFRMRAVNNIQGHTLQCVLPINLFNEKIFICIWFGLLILSTMNLTKLIFWIVSVCMNKEQTKYVKVSRRNLTFSIIINKVILIKNISSFHLNNIFSYLYLLYLSFFYILHFIFRPLSSSSFFIFN